MTTEYSLRKRYEDGGHTTERRIAKPVSGSVGVALDGVDVVMGVEVTLDVTTGLLTFVEPPADGVQITAGFVFHTPVRFDTDRLDLSTENFGAGEAPDVPVVEILI